MTSAANSPNVYGIETEYSCMLSMPNDVVYEIVGECHSVDSQLGLYIEPEITGASILSSGMKLRVALIGMGMHATRTGMLSNGGRLYVDPSGFEYATPETRTAEEAVIRSFDGDKIVRGVLNKFIEEGLLSHYQLNRRNVDHNRASRGVHLNTCTSLNNTEPSHLVAQRLAALNVAKGAIFGSGGLLVDEHGKTAYHHSPRLSITDQFMVSAFDRRPLVRGPFKSDGERLSRIETVTSDALNFAWPLRASLITTNSLVRLMELGYGDKLPNLADPIKAAHTVGRYGSDCKVLVERSGAERMMKQAPLDIIRSICELALEIDDSLDYLDTESRQVLPEVIEVADKMTHDIYSVANQVESVGRLMAIERKMQQSGVSLDSEKICRFDYAWDWIGGGIAENLRNKSAFGWQGFTLRPATHSGVKSLIKPPRDTRAHVRGEAIMQSKGTDDSTWSIVDSYKGEFSLSPLETELPITD